MNYLTVIILRKTQYDEKHCSAYSFHFFIIIQKPYKKQQILSPLHTHHHHCHTHSKVHILKMTINTHTHTHTLDSSNIPCIWPLTKLPIQCANLLCEQHLPILHFSAIHLVHLGISFLHVGHFFLQLHTCALNLVVLADQPHPGRLQLSQLGARLGLLVLPLPVDLLDLFPHVLWKEDTNTIIAGYSEKKSWWKKGKMMTGIYFIIKNISLLLVL